MTEFKVGDRIRVTRVWEGTVDRAGGDAQVISFKGFGWVCMVLGLALIFLGLAIGRADAYSANDQLPTPTGSNEVFMGWRAQSGTVCFSYPDNGSLRPLVSAAVNAWDKSQARVIRRNDCAASGFAASETVRMAFAPGTKDGRDPSSWCAITPAGGFSGDVPRVDAGPVYVKYKLTGLVTIWINQDLVRGCRADTAAWQHLITHELGHRIGLGHDAGGPMTDRSGLPNATNIAQVNLLY